MPNYNFLFVIDATHSMDPYIKAVIIALEKIVDRFCLIFKKGKCNFGVILYRDFDDNP